MSIYLKSSSEELKAKFFKLRTVKDLADLLEIKPGYLNYILQSIPPDDRYKTFSIPKKKSGKVRIIHSPIPPIKIIQHKLKQVLEVIYEPRCSVYGFIKEKSIVDNAKAHKKKTKLKYVFNIDLEDFFPSIHFGRVRGLFTHTPYNLPYRVAQCIAKICCYKGGLPQGAPTSPIISNMICNKMDSQLQRLAQKRRCTYTRYADDITFSTSMSRFPTSIAERIDGKVSLGFELKKILKENRFKVNKNKIHFQEWTQRQEITGLTVNRFPNVRRTYIRQIRAMLHDWEINGLDKAEQKHLTLYHSKHRYPAKPQLSFRDIVLGKVSFVGMVRGKDDPIYRKFMKQLSLLDKNIHFEDKVVEIVTKKSAKIFISYAREDEETVNKLYDDLEKSGYKPWMDKRDIHGGENWERAINRSIEGCDLFIAVLSKNSVLKRGVLQKEIARALDKWEEKMEDDIFVIPLRLDECDPPHRLKKFQWIDYFAANGWNRLTQSIQESLRRASEE